MVVSSPVAYWNVQESMNLRLPVTIVTLWLILSIKTRSSIPPDFVLQKPMTVSFRAGIRKIWGGGYSVSLSYNLNHWAEMVVLVYYQFPVHVGAFRNQWPENPMAYKLSS